MPPGDFPAKTLVITFATLMVLVIFALILFNMIDDPSGFFRGVEIWIQENL